MPPSPALYIAAMGEEARAWAFSAAADLRRQGIWVELTPQDKSLKAQLRRANKMNSAKVLILGPDELKAGKAQIKDMATSEQSEIALDQVVSGLAPA